MRCAGSLAASGKPKDDSNKFAREGTAAHELGETVLLLLDDGRSAADYIGLDIVVPYIEDGVEKSEVFTVDEDMARYVQVYVDQVAREPGELLIEERLDMSPVYGVDDQFGTGDAIVLDYENERLYVGDLKYGRGVQVYAEGNEQLYSYGAAAFMQFDMLCEWKTITVAVHQPRLHHYDEYTLTRDEMLAWIEKAKLAAKTAMALYNVDCNPEDIEAMKTPGEKQCQWCPIKGACAALAKFNHETIFEDFVELQAEPDQTRQPITMTDAELAAVWKRRDLINGWLTEVQSETKNRLEAGMELPGLKLVAGRAGARKWEDPADAEVQLKKSRLKKDEMFKMTLITPPQAEKLLKKDKPRVWAKMEKLITQNEGAPAVALHSDNRPALKVATEDQFADVSDDDFGDLI